MWVQRSSLLGSVRCCWLADCDADGVWADAANEFWGLAFSQFSAGGSAVELIGPSLRPRALSCAIGDRHWGVEFEAHAFWSGLRKGELLNGIHRLASDGHWFELAGARYPFTQYDELESLVEALEAQGTLRSDTVVASALAGDATSVSIRSVQRRFRDHAGLGPKQVDQLRRARQAYSLLQRGLSPIEAAFQAGYADQAHLTRSLGRYTGCTPSRVRRSSRRKLQPLDGD